MVTIRPITFTPASRPTQTRYLPSGATIRGVQPPSATQEYSTEVEHPERKPGAAPGHFEYYTVQAGYWYGVKTIDGMKTYTKLTPATEATTHYEQTRLQPTGTEKPTFTEGSAGNVVIAPSAKPEPPPKGSTKKAVRAYAESYASWQKEQMWRQIPEGTTHDQITDWWTEKGRFTTPSDTRIVNEIIAYEEYQRYNPAKYNEIIRQYNQQQGMIVSSSGTLYPAAGGGYVSSKGERFIPTTPTVKAPEITQLPTVTTGYNVPTPTLFPGVGMITSIARQKLGMDYISGGTMLTSALQANKAPAVTGPIIPTETKLAIRNVALTLPGIRTVWSAGEYIGLDYLLGVKTTEYNKQYSALESQGLISGTEFRGSEAQYKSLNANYQQIESLQKMQGVALDRTLGVNLAGAQAGERWKVPGTQFEPATAAYDFGHGLTTQFSDSWKGIQGGIGKMFEPVAPVAVTMVAGGMMMTGMSPQVIPHTISFVKGFGQGVAATPEFIGMAVVGAEGLIKYPQAVPGAAILGGYIQAKGIYEGVTTRPVEFAGEMYGTALALGAMGRVGYAASPVKYTSAAFEARGRPTATYRGLYAESPVRGVRNLVLGGVEGLGTRQLGGITSYEGRPWYRPTVSGGTPSHLVDYLGEGYPDYPALGVKIALTQERLTREGNRPDLISFRQELQTMDQLFRIRPSTIKNPLQEIQNIHGMTEGAGRDFLTTLRDQFPTHRVGGSLGQAVQSRFSRAAADIDLYLLEEQIPAGRTFVTEWNRRHGTNIKVDIHEYPQPGSFIGRYGIRTEKDITVEGINIMPVREQALRKLSQPMMLRNVEGAWRILPEAHRGKDIADTIGALQSEMYRLQESPGSFLYRGRMRGLQESIDVQVGKMQPGALPVERIGGRTYDPSGAAAARYRQYRWDYTESPYVKIPGTRTYVDILQYDIFNRPIPIYQELGIGPQTPGGIIFEVGGKVRLHPEEIKMWEQMVIDESRGVVPPEDIRLWTKEGDVLKDFRKRRSFGQVEVRLSNKAQKVLDASTHTHPEMPKHTEAYYLKSEIKTGVFLDKFKKFVGKAPTWKQASEQLFYKSEIPVLTPDAPLHVGDTFAGIIKGERTHVVLGRDYIYYGRIKKLPKKVLGAAFRDPTSFDKSYIRLLKERGGVLSEPERANLAWEAYRQVTLESTGKYYRDLGGVYKRIPIEEVTNFAEFSPEARTALDVARKSTLEAYEFTYKQGLYHKFVKGLSRIDEGARTPATKISGGIYKTIDIPETAYPSTFKPPQASGVLPFVTYPAAKVLPTIPPRFKAAYPSSVPPQPAADFESLIGYSPAIKKQPDRMKQFTTTYPDITRLVPGKYPGIVPPGVPMQYPPFTPPGKTPYPGITKTGVTPYPTITKIIPEKYPGITTTGITPYPGITKTIPEKYPGVRITSGGKKTITGITSGGFGGFKIEEFITETTRQFIPKTTPAPITIPHRWLTLTEETPHKKRPLKLHYDVLASKWNIESPVPRIPQAFGWGKLARQAGRNELKIFNLQKSRTPLVYMKHRPFEQFEGIKVPKVI